MGIFERFFSRSSKVAKRLAEEIEILHNSPLVDPVWYRQTYPDLGDKPLDVARHYIQYGAAEGRNPHPLFDTKFYLEQNPDVAASGMNPLVHYVLRGAAEGRKPNLHFDTSSSQKQSSVVEDNSARAHELHQNGGPLERTCQNPEVTSNPHIQRDSESNIVVKKEDVAEYFDAEFYLEKNPDVAAARCDPLEHYFVYGWKEDRDPAPWFSSTHYLDANQDVAAANVNPFWHYVMYGRNERRSPKRTIGVPQSLLEHLTPPEERKFDLAPLKGKRISEADLLGHFEAATQQAAGLVISFSHTCYPTTTGGIELFVGDEQKLFNAQCYAYLHFSPPVFSYFVRDTSPDEALTQVTLNGDMVGVAAVSEVVRVLERANCTALRSRILTVHCAMGQSTLGFLRILSAFDPTSCYYWIHDYSSICTGFNLLRNDIEFCHAPPQESAACTICVYGSSRRRNAEQLRQIFKAANFTVVAPSVVAESIWLKASELPRRAIVVQEHCKVDYSAGLRREHPSAEKIGFPGHPVKVAFVGPPLMHKGGPAFERIVEEARGDPVYQFFHFAKPGTEFVSRRIRAIHAVVTADRRDTMIELLREHEIDIVVIPAPWPETFSYVTFESLAAGCDIVTLGTSGNVAATVQRTERGRVLGSEDELVEFFTRHHAVELVRARASQPNPCGTLLHCGTTAALSFRGAH